LANLSAIISTHDTTSVYTCHTEPELGGPTKLKFVLILLKILVEGGNGGL